MPTTTTVPSVERALQILEVLDASRRGMNIAELGRKLDIPRSTAHVLVLTLERCGYVTKSASSRNYMLSMKVFNLGREMVQNQKLSEIALEPMKWLSAQARLTSHLAVLENDQAVYVQKVEGPGFIRFDTTVGKRTNLHCTSVGKVLLAYCQEVHRKEFLSKMTYARYTRKTITTAAALRVELAKTAERGYAIDDEEEELEVRCLAVPVFNPRGELVAALSVTGTLGTIVDQSIPPIVSLLQRASARICNYAEAREEHERMEPETKE